MKSKRTVPNMYFVGVDPGTCGGIAVLSNGKLVLAESFNRPLEEVWELFNWLSPLLEKDPGCVAAVIEKVHSMPGQGVSSTFKFGTAFGAQRFALVAAGIPYREVDPQKWMAYYDMKRKENETQAAWKNRLMALASRMYSKVTRNTADAILIARYTRAMYTRGVYDQI